MIRKFAIHRGVFIRQLAQQPQQQVHRGGSCYITNNNGLSLRIRSISSLDKLKNALEEYRVQNYGNCMPSRFKKDIVRAAVTNTKEEQNVVTIDSLLTVIANIGADQKVSRHDMETIFSEIVAAHEDGTSSPDSSGRSDKISKERMMNLL